MDELVYERIKTNLTALNMKNTLTILDNYLEQAIHEKTNIVEILDHILQEEALAKKNRAVESQIHMSAFPFKKTLDSFEPAEKVQRVLCFFFAQSIKKLIIKI